MALEIQTTQLRGSANLKHYWRLHDLIAEVGGVTLTNNNSVGFSSAQFANGADFGSANSSKYLSTTNDLGIAGGASSYSLWIKLNAEITSLEWVFFIQADAGTNTAFFIRYAYNAGSPQLQYVRRKTGGTDTVITINGALGTSVWHHLVLTYDGATLSNYKDGVLGTTASVSGNGVSGAVDGFIMGATQVPDSYTSAIVDDFSVFDRALTATEISDIYNNSLGGAVISALA